MGENLNAQKICPACGTPNKSNNIYCSSCGFRLSEVDPNKFEIIDTSKKKAYINFFLGVLFLVLILIAQMYSSNVYLVIFYLIMASLFFGSGFYFLRKSK